MKTVKELVESNIEPDEPQTTILRVLKDNNGKRIDQRIIKKMIEAAKDDSISLRKEYGMTSVEWGGYSISGGNKGGQLHIAHKAVDVIIDADYVESYNARHFSAREKRNEERQSHTDQDYSNIEKAIDGYKTAKAHLKDLLKDFDADRYAILREILNEPNL